MRRIAVFLALIFAPVAAWAWTYGSPSGGGGGTCAVNAVCATQTIANLSGGTISGVPIQLGQGFARGDVPGCLSSNTPIPQDHTGTNLSYQIDEASSWDDGSCRHLNYTLLSPSILNSATEQLKFERVASAYTPGSDSGSTSDITTGHDFQVVLTDVRDHTNTTIGSGNFTFDTNTCIADGTTWVYATGPYRHGLGVACTAPDTTSANVQTTINQVGGIASSSTTGNITVATIPAGCNTSTTVNQIVKVDHEYALVLFVNSTTFNFVTRGAARSTAASHSNGATITCEGNFFAFLYFDIYRQAGGSIYSIGHMPMVMQPWQNIVGADFTSYRADYNDNGVGDVRTWTGSTSITQNATNISTSNGTISMPAFSDAQSTVLQRSECVEFSSSGSLPTTSPQIATGQPYWVGLSSGTNYKLYSTIDGPAHGTNIISISNVGSGTLTIKRRTCHAYREGWFSAADDAGHENFTANAATMTGVYPKLTSTEQQYWIKSGLVPPVNTALSPNTLTALNATGGAGSTADSSAYRPGIAIQTWNAIGAAGGPPGAAPIPLWDVVAFLRQDQTNWDFDRAAALGKIHMPWVAQLQEATGHIQPLNDGANRFNTSCVDSGTGTAYSTLGTAQPTFTYNGNHQNAVAVPASGSPGAALTDGVFDITGGDGMEPSQGHWPMTPYLAYLFFGREWMLDLLYMDANNAIMVRQVPVVYSNRAKNRQIQLGGSGTIYYAQFPFGADRTTHTLADVAVASGMGSTTTHQERSYAADVLQENDCGMKATLAFQNAGQGTLGLWDLDTGGADGLTTVWGSWGYIWAYAMARNSDWSTIAGRFATREQTVWGEVTNGWSSFYGSAEYITNFTDPTVKLIGGSDNWNDASWKTAFSATADHLGFTSPSGSGGAEFSATNASPTVITTTLSSDFNLSNGDKFKCLGSTYNAGTAPGGAYSGPSQCQPLNNPSSNAEWFYVCNESGTGGTVTFNIASDSGCTTLIAFTASWSSQAFALHPAAAPDATHCVLLSVNCTTWDGKGQYAYHFATVNWLTSLGLLSNSSATYLNINARVLIPTATYQGNPTYDYSYQPVQ